MNLNGTNESVEIGLKPTKRFLLEQIETCKQAIFQNQGALNLCQWMLKNGCFIEDEIEPQKEK